MLHGYVSLLVSLMLSLIRIHCCMYALCIVHVLRHTVFSVQCVLILALNLWLDRILEDHTLRKNARICFRNMSKSQQRKQVCI